MFTMITPTVRVHLSLLSRLSLALRTERWRRTLVERASQEEILGTLRDIEVQWAERPAGGS